MGPLARYWRSRRGAVVYITAILLPVIFGMGAMAVDLGSIFLQSRQLQGDADLATLAAANNLGDAQAAANATANANGFHYPVQAAVTLGTYTPNGSVAVSQRFTTGGSANNAAKVTLTTKADLFFGASILGASTVNISRTATAAVAQEAAFSLGSGLLSVNGGIENALLSALTGSTVSLQAVDYNSLASANVDLLQYSQQLQTDLKLTGVSYNNVLSSQVTTAQALTAMGQVLSTNGNDEAATAINTIAAAAGTATLPLNQLIDLGPYGNQDHASGGSGAGVAVNALQMMSAILQLANGSRQVQLNLGANVPGVAQTTVYVATGQRMSSSPWITVTDANTVVLSTAQTRIYINAQLAPALNLLGVSSVDVPVYVEVASAEAKLSSLTCPTASTAENVTLSVAPSVGEVAVGTVDTIQLSNFTNELSITPDTLLSAPVPVTAYAVTCLGGVTPCQANAPSEWTPTSSDWQSVSFSASEIAAGTVKQVSTTNLATATITSLFGSLQLNVGGIGVSSAVVDPIVQPLLTAAAPGLDSTLNSLENLLGVGLGNGYATVNGVRCNDAALVA